MTQIEFHFNSPDKLAYVCRLLRKAVSQGHRIIVASEPELLRRLDKALWALSPHEFISHCTGGEDEFVLAQSSVVLVENFAVLQQIPIAINLRPEVPSEFAQFERLIEVVSDDPLDRAQARERWRHYTSMGYSLIRHDLNLKNAP